MKRLGPELKMPNFKGMSFKKPALNGSSFTRPSLKGSNIKMPPFLVDLYWDLWDRRLLPLIGVVLVAIVAVPIVLGGSDESSEPEPVAGTVASALAGQESGSTLTVVQAEPGLRAYQKRLMHRTPHDPFKPKGGPPSTVGAVLNQPPGAEAATTSVPLSGAGSGGNSTGQPVPVSGGGGGSGNAVPSQSAPSPQPSPPAESGGAEGGSGGNPTVGAHGTTHVTVFSVAVDARISRSGGRTPELQEQKVDPWVVHKALPLTALPSEKAPVVTFMGLSKKENPLLLVSTHVLSIFGEARCVSGDQVCQLLEVEPGFPVTFVYGFNEVHWTVKILKVEPVVVASGDSKKALPGAEGK